MADENHDSLKAALRAEVRQRMAGLSDHALQEASARAGRRLLGLPELHQANVVLFYLPLPGEVDVAPAIADCLARGKRVCVPLIDWSQHDMTPVELASLDEADMVRTRYGLRVPRGAAAVAASAVDVVVVPGLAFDDHGHRLGRGGGFYDRFLARMHAGAAKVAMAFEAQIIPQVPMAVTDVGVDVVVTEQREIRPGSSAVGS